MTAQQQALLDSAFSKVQSDQAKYTEYRNHALGMQAVLDADPIKYSTTILNYDGLNYTRQDLQANQIAYAGQAAGYLSQLQASQQAYNVLKAGYEAQDAAALAASQAAAQNSFNIANPGVAKELANKVIEATTKQSTTKYLIYGAIGIVVIIGIIIVIRAKTKIA